MNEGRREVHVSEGWRVPNGCLIRDPALHVNISYLQVLAGDIEEAICTHALHYSIWRKYGALPERFDFSPKEATVLFYPLRPELAESTYFLYQATRNPFYLHVGSQILEDLEAYTKAE